MGYENMACMELSLTIATSGFYIFPVHSRREKDGYCTCGRQNDCHLPAMHPVASLTYGKSWKEISTIDVSTIKQWYAAKPYINTAIDCQRSGIVVLEFNNKTVDGINGAEEFGRLRGEFPDAFSTMIVRTGGDGYQTYYFQPENAIIGCSHYGFMDVKGHGGYVMTPGSMHISGKRYTFLEGHGIHDTPIIDMPCEIIGYLRGLTPVCVEKPNIPAVADISKYMRAPSADDVKIAQQWLHVYVGRAQLGSRHNTAWLLALQLRDNGVCYDTSVSTMKEYAAKVNAKTKHLPNYHYYSEGDTIVQLRNALQQPKREPARGRCRIPRVPTAKRSDTGRAEVW